MASLLPRRLRDKFFPEALPSMPIFAGKTALVTGATSGLGLAAAIHFATLGANVILTSRDASKGAVAKEHIERCAGTVGQGKVQAIVLDMNRYSSCVSLVDELKQSSFCREGLDIAVLNAGLINVDYLQSAEGWEQTLQVHTLSTTLLGLLLLDFMRQGQRKASTKPHLIFVTSRKHLIPDISGWARLSTQGGILQHFSDEKNFHPEEIDPNYSETKLMLTYTVEQLARRAVGPNGKPDVIINSVCPGLVTTDLGRQIPKLSLLMRIWVPIYFNLFGKSADYGARSYVIAATTSEGDHGKYIQSIYTDDEYDRLSTTNIKSETAILVRYAVWKEITTELRSNVPRIADVLSSLEDSHSEKKMLQ